MDLQDFISKALLAVIGGVSDAQKRASELGAHVNPGGLMRTTKSIADNSIWDNTTNNYARNISFDVAITVEEGTKTDAKINVLGGMFNLGAGGASENKQLAVSRIQFSVPILLPVSKVSSEARKKRNQN